MAVDIKFNNAAEIEAYCVNSTVQSGLIQNVLNSAGQTHFKDPDTGLLPVIGCDIYKSIYPFNTWIRSFIECSAGGHYYCHSTFSDAYNKASIQIPVNEAQVILPSGTNRRAFISMGMLTEGDRIRMCDIGIARDRDSGAWYAFSWCKNATSADVYSCSGVGGSGGSASPYVCGANDRLTIEYSVGRTGGKDYVKAEFKVGGSTKASIEYRVPNGEMFKGTSGAPELSFVRFMSMVPMDNNGAHDDRDLTAMSAALHNATLYSGTTAYPWNASRIRNAWVMQAPQNVDNACIGDCRSSSTIGATSDYCHIYHCTQVH